MFPNTDPTNQKRLWLRRPSQSHFTNGNLTIFVLAESIFMGASTLTPPAPATSLFFFQAPAARHLCSGSSTIRSSFPRSGIFFPVRRCRSYGAWIFLGLFSTKMPVLRLHSAKPKHRQPLRIGGVAKHIVAYAARLLMGPAQSLAPAAPMACTRNQFSAPLGRLGMVQLDFLPT